MTNYGEKWAALGELNAQPERCETFTGYRIGLDYSEDNPEGKMLFRRYETDRDAIERGENEGMRCAFRPDNGPAGGAQDRALGVSPDQPTRPDLPRTAS